EGGPLDLPLRAPPYPLNPLARRDVPFTQARSSATAHCVKCVTSGVPESHMSGSLPGRVVTCCSPAYSHQHEGGHIDLPLRTPSYPPNPLARRDVPFTQA